ncbi:SDR family oxidoreductase [Streptomyces sp. NPDC057939]|uniref:SDR family oxidoreductase n=1 Tax=Streptomyces sp. NPDC057939 TaxID=3346284 RepID=UPI0036E33771
MSNLVHNWARQSRERRFRVNVISTGPTRTPGLVGAAGPELDRFADAVVHLGRLADPQEIAEAALFLASDPSSFITGAELFANGGYTRA